MCMYPYYAAHHGKSVGALRDILGKTSLVSTVQHSTRNDNLLPASLHASSSSAYKVPVSAKLQQSLLANVRCDATP